MTLIKHWSFNRKKKATQPKDKQYSLGFVVTVCIYLCGWWSLQDCPTEGVRKGTQSSPCFIC